MIHFLRITYLMWRTSLMRTLLTKRSAIMLLGCCVLPALAWFVLTVPRRGPTPIEAFLYPSWFVGLQMLVPLAAVLGGSGVISEEIDDRTITYLLTRPIARASILVGRWLASATILFVFVGASVWAHAEIVEYKSASYVPQQARVIEFRGRDGDMHKRTIPATNPVLVAATADGRLPGGVKVAVLTAALLGAAAYSALFAAIGTFNKHPMIVGLGYCFAIEGFLANLPGTSQTWTIQYYLRSFVLDRHPELWNLLEGVALKKHDTATEAVTTLVGVLLVALVAGSLTISRRQYVLSA